MAETAPTSDNDADFVITIDDTSPTIVYSPSADSSGGTNPAAGWLPSYTETGLTPDPSTGAGAGISLHVTSADGASLALRWNGTAVALYGIFPVSAPGFPSAISYLVSLDGTSTTNYASSISPDNDPASSVLASFTNLTNGEHLVEITMHNPDDLDDATSLLQFDRAVITSALPSQSTQQASNVTLATRTLADDKISFRGQWSFNSNLLPSQSASFHTSTNIGDRASLQFNGTSVTLAGLTTPQSGSYNISLDNGPPETLSAHSSFNLSSPTLLFFRTGLDPNVAHQLDVVNAGALADGQGSLLILGSVNVTTVAQNSSGAGPSSTMSSPTLRRGTIAAVAVGVGLAVIALVALAVFYVRRRRRDKQRKEDFIVNPAVSHRRLSFMRRARRSQQVDAEKARPKGHHAHPSADVEILDISGRKDDDDDEDEDDGHETSMLQIPGHSGRASRHGSQNSDGSYSISLPELPGRGHVRVRSDGDSPSPTQRYAPASPPMPMMPARSPLLGHPASPRSPKPRGPREMRSSTFREGPQGILLKEMRTPLVDAPDMGFQDTLRADTAALATQSQPVTPLRVNFDEGEARPQRRSRSKSAVSGISLPASLKQALSWAQGRSSDSPPERQPSEPEPYPRYSFLDMESSASQSQSSGSRSTRQSHSAQSQTVPSRASSRSRHQTEASGSTGPASTDPQPPRDDHRISLGFSMTMAGGPTSSRPSLSPNISLQAVPLPPITVPEPRVGAEDVPQSVHPADLAELLPSPTDSIPLTVSDIHFRHSTQSSLSPTADAPDPHRLSAAHRAGHPPLPHTPTLAAPPTPRPDPRPYIIQKLVGAPDAGPGPSTPFNTPRFPTAGPASPESTPRMSSPASTTPESTVRGSSAGPSGPRMSRKPARGSTIGPSFSYVMTSRPSTRSSEG